MHNLFSLSLFLTIAFCIAEISFADGPTWMEAWNSPKEEHRPLHIVHGWLARNSDHEKEVNRLKNCGLGGIVCNVQEENYLQDEANWKRFVDSVNAARAAGLRIWIYDESGYPSLRAGGVLLDGHRELESLALVYDKDDPEEPFALRPAYEFTHTSNNYAGTRRYPNPLDVAATKRFLAVTHEEYRKRLGNELFDQVEAFFTDEPSMMATNFPPLHEATRHKLKIIDPLDPNVKPLPMVSWVHDLPERYKEKYGEDLLPQRKSLFAGDSAEDKRIRRQYWSLLGELFKEHYFGEIQDWCHAAGCSVPTARNPSAPLRRASSGHGLAEESLTHHVPFDGNKMQALARMDVPGLDMLDSRPMAAFHAGWKAAGFPCSAAFLTGKRLVMTELSDHVQKNYSQDKKPADLALMQAASAWQAAWGVTEFTLYYRIEDRGDEIHRRYCDFVGRLNAVLRNAVPCRPVLLYYPIEKIQEEYLPTVEPLALRRQPMELQKAVDSFEQLGGHLTRTQIPFTIIDTDFLMKAELKGGQLEIGGHRFHTLIFPDIDLPENVTKKIDALRQSGFRVLVHHRDEISFPKMAKLEPANANIVFGHFRRDGSDIYLLTNTDTNNAYEGRLANVAETRGFILDPETGSKTPLDLTVRLASLQTLFYIIH